VASLAVQPADTMRELDKAFVLLGSVGQNHGSVVEAFFLNGLEAKPVQSGVRYDEASDNVEDFSGKLRREYDAVMANGKWQMANGKWQMAKASR
jgi:hypothetical protein